MVSFHETKAEIYRSSYTILIYQFDKKDEYQRDINVDLYENKTMTCIVIQHLIRDRKISNPV